MRMSVVTISFNQGAFLERAIQSVLEQDHPDIEYIVVDPGSTDGSRDIIARHRHRLSSVILDPDAGPADGLNRGLAAATGDIFAFLNADDRFLPGAAGAAMAAFAADPSVDVVYGHGQIDDRRVGTCRSIRATTPVTPWLLAHGGVELLQQATFYRTAAVRGVGGFNPANRTCWDGELWAELLAAGCRFKLLPTELGVFTLHPQSITGNGNNGDRFRADWARIARRLTGRDPHWTDPVRRLAARGAKWALNPKALALRIAGGPV